MTGWARCIPLNRRGLKLYALAALSVAAGWLLPGLLVRDEVSFMMACLLSALQEIMMFGLPAWLLLRALPGAKGIREALHRPGAYYSGLAMLSAVSFVLVGALLGAMFYTLLTSLGLEPALPPVITPASLPELLLAALTIGGVTAVCEELFFRFALPQTLGRFLGPRLTVAVCALLFAVLHLNVAGIPTLLLFALLMHRLLARRGSLLLPVIFHAMYNFSILVINYSQAAPNFQMILLSAGLFTLGARLLMKEEKNEADRPGL